MNIQKNPVRAPRPAPAVTRLSLVDRAIAALREKIASADWPVGSRIPCEADLVAQLGVSRTTVREAVRGLSQAGVLEVLQGDGTYVRRRDDPMEVMRRLNHAALRDHHELRCLLNAECGRLAARRRSDEDVQHLRQLLEVRGELRHASSIDQMIHDDQAFHQAIADATGNRALAELYRYFATDDAAHMEVSLTTGTALEHEYEHHLQLLQAIERRDEEAAAEAAWSIARPLLAFLEQGGEDENRLADKPGPRA